MGGEFKYCIISLTTFEVGSSAYNTLKESMKKIAKITKVLCTLYCHNEVKYFSNLHLYIFKLKTKQKHLKFGLPEKHTKFEKIFLMVWMFTK